MLSSYTLNSLDGHAIRVIASLMPGHRLWKLYACGDGRLNYNLENSVDSVRMYTPIAGVRIVDEMNDTNHRLFNKMTPTHHPSFWYRFKFIKHIVIGRGVPLPLAESGYNLLSLPQHMLANLHCLTLHIPTSKSLSVWNNLMVLGESMHCLRNLTYSKYLNYNNGYSSCVDRSEDDSLETLTFLLPDSMKQGLVHLNVDIRFKYWLCNLPPNLESLNICGALADFEYLKENGRGLHSSPNHSTSSMMEVSQDTSFPGSLSMLYFTALRLNEPEGLPVERKRNFFKSTEFHLALPHDLKLLTMISHVNPFYITSELLPRGLKSLSVNNLIGRDYSSVSISNLPPGLETWRGTTQPAIREDTEVALPSTLKILSFIIGFSRYKWSNVTYPNPHLRIQNLDTTPYYTGGNDPFFLMVESAITPITINNRTLLPIIPNCKSLRLNVRDDSWTIMMRSLPSYLTRLKLMSVGDLNAKSTLLDKPSSSSSTSPFETYSFFGLLPRTLQHLHIVTEKPFDTLNVKQCNVDLASILPNLWSLTINGSGTNTIHPTSLPQTLRTITIGHSHRVNFGHILSLLPECIEECELHGDLEKETMETFIPAHIGAQSSCGVSLELCVYNYRQLGIHCEELMASIRSRNVHLNMVKIHDRSRGYPTLAVSPYRGTFYKRVEYE